MQLQQQQLLQQQNKVLPKEVSHGSDPLTPLTNKKKENLIVVTKDKLTTKVGSSSSYKQRNGSDQETLRHRITPSNSERSAKDKDKVQVIRVTVGDTRRPIFTASHLN